MNAKRYRKMDALASKYRLFRRYGPKKADVGILCWGSTAGVVREAIDKLAADGIKVAVFVPRLLAPLPVAEIEAFMSDCAEIVVTELSFAKQFYQYLRTVVDLPRTRTHVFARSGGKNLGVNEIISQVRSVLAAKTENVEVLA
jgi:2-oxoglutarate ferredoxin oxidoreductase subunit alpha